MFQCFEYCQTLDGFSVNTLGVQATWIKSTQNAPYTSLTLSKLLERSQTVINREKINQVKVEYKVQDKEEILEEDDDEKEGDDEKEDDDEKEAPGVVRQELITD